VSRSGSRVLFYTETTSRGGAEISLRNLVAALDPAVEVVVMGVDADVCSWIASARPDTEVRIVRAPTNKFAVRRFFAVRREIARERAQIFHANLRTVADARYSVLAALTVSNLKVVVTEHAPLRPGTRLGRWLKRQTSKRLAAHVAVGERAARIVEQGAGLPTGSVVTVHNGVPDHGAAAPRGDSRPVVVGTLARLDRDKRIDVLIDAVGPLADVALVVAGEGPERGALLSHAAQRGIGERMQLLPWSETARLLDDVDVFVLPSQLEGFPLSILEAMMAGRPVVATDVGSVPEAVVDGTTGLLVRAGDVEGLRGALARLAASPEERRRMGAAGRRRALEHFTADGMARRFEQLYDDILEGAARCA
jgi:glycosyltransferase involved in cell wall biosynthesis